MISLYINQGLSLMIQYEALRGGMFEDHFPELAQQFWDASDAKNKGKLMYIVNQLGKLVETGRDPTNMKEKE